MKSDQLLAQWLVRCGLSDTARADPRISADDYGRTVKAQIAALHACRADGWTIEELSAIRRQKLGARGAPRETPQREVGRV